MDSGKISTRYARALYLFAADKGEETSLWNSMKSMADQFVAMPDLKRVLDNPTVTDREKEKLLLTASSAAGNETVAKAIRLIVENDRAQYAQSIALMYDKFYRSAKKMLKAALTTVTPPDNAMQQTLIALVKNGETGETVDFATTIDDSIIGGFVLQIDDRRLDASISNQLNKMKLEMTKN